MQGPKEDPIGSCDRSVGAYSSQIKSGDYLMLLALACWPRTGADVDRTSHAESEKRRPIESSTVLALTGRNE
jgi:hypothetical protein